MKREEFDILPYQARKGLIDLREYCLIVLEANSNMIYKDDVDTVLHQFRDKTGQFAFNIKNVKFNENTKENYYTVYFSPENLVSIKGVSSQSNLEHLKISFSRWIDNVKKMHSVTEEYYNPEGKFYDEEFADFFTNDDEDSATKPFEIERQEILYYFLTYAEAQIEKSDGIDEEKKIDLINEVNTLKNNIPSLTKKRFVAALSKIAQKTKTISNKLFHDVFDVLKKEVIKKILYTGAEHIPDAINKIEHWIKLLQ
jgi:hypothetical protein